MKGFWGAIIAAMSYVIFSGGHGYAETWSCAINDKTWPYVQQYRREGNVLRDLTADETLREMSINPDEIKGFVYNILLDNDYALIAELDFTETNSDKVREIYVVNIIIGKVTGNLIVTSVLSHLPEPNKIDAKYGSCTVDK